MKKPQMIFLLLVLLLALLIPAVYWSGTGTNTVPQPEQQMSEGSISPVDSGDKAAPSPDVQTDSGEKAADVPEKQPASDSGTSNSNNDAGKSPEAKPGDTAQSLAGTRVAVAVVGKNGEILFGPADIKLAPDKPANALSVLAATGLPYIMSTRFPDLVISIAGQENLGGSGWMYKVNNEIASVAAPKKPVCAGDRVIWWYSSSLDAPSPQWESLAK